MSLMKPCCPPLAQAASVEPAAERLLRVAIEYMGRRAHATMDDDTTAVLVVELNPTGVKHVPPGQMSGCCLRTD